MAVEPRAANHGRGRVAVRVCVLVTLYLLLANARSVQPNPVNPDAIMAIQVIVPVIAGLLSGPRIGALVGGLGTLLAVAVHALKGLAGGDVVLGSSNLEFEAVMVLPNIISGALSGWLSKHLPSPLPASALAAAHLLGILGFALLGYLPPENLRSSQLWLSVAWESFIGIALVTAAVGIYRLALSREAR